MPNKCKVIKYLYNLQEIESEINKDDITSNLKFEDLTQNSEQYEKQLDEYIDHFETKEAVQEEIKIDMDINKPHDPISTTGTFIEFQIYEKSFVRRIIFEQNYLVLVLQNFI